MSVGRTSIEILVVAFTIRSLPDGLVRRQVSSTRDVAEARLIAVNAFIKGRSFRSGLCGSAQDRRRRAKNMDNRKYIGMDVNQTNISVAVSGQHPEAGDGVHHRNQGT
jgi:hypothetical protein